MFLGNPDIFTANELSVAEDAAILGFCLGFVVLRDVAAGAACGPAGVSLDSMSECGEPCRSLSNGTSGLCCWLEWRPCSERNSLN